MKYVIIFLSQFIVVIILSLYDDWKVHKIKFSEEERSLELEKLKLYYKEYPKHSGIDIKINIYGNKIKLLKQKTKWKLSTDSSKDIDLFIPGYAIGYDLFRKIQNDPDKILFSPNIPDRYPAWLYQLSRIIEPYEEDLKKTLKYTKWNRLNFRPIRIDKGKSLTITVEPVSYYYSLIGELSTDKIIFKDTNITLRDVLTPYFLATITDDNDLDKEVSLTSESPLPNTLGIEALIIYQDGSILIKRRSKRVAVEKEKIDPGISGGLDWGTLFYFYKLHDNKPVPLSDVVKQILTSKDELTTKEIDKLKLYVISITRNLRYLGKMNFFLLGYNPDNWENVINSIDINRYFEIGDIIIIRIKTLWDKITNKGSEISLCRLLEYIKIGVIDYILYNLEQCERNFENCPILFSGNIVHDNEYHNIEIYQVTKKNEIKLMPILNNNSSPGPLTFKDFSAVFQIIIKSLYDAYNEYCSDHL